MIKCFSGLNTTIGLFNILDAENKLIIEDIILSRELFSKDYIKLFLETSFGNFDVKTIITEGYYAYASILMIWALIISTNRTQQILFFIFLLKYF